MKLLMSFFFLMIAFPKTWAQAYNPSYPENTFMCKLTEINCTSAGRYSIELSARNSFEVQNECRLLSRRTNHQFCMVWIK